MKYAPGTFCVVPIQNCLGWEPAEQTLYMWLCFHANHESGECFPSHQRLADECGLSLSSIKRVLNKLVKRGVLKIDIQYHGNGSQTSNLYHVFICPASPERDGGRSHRPPPGSHRPTPPVQSDPPPPVHTDPPYNNKKYMNKKNLLTYIGGGSFESIWALYPKRGGPNSKAAALKAYEARRREGVPHEDLYSSTQNYAKYCEAKGILKTEYVMQARRFFGPSKEFESFITIDPEILNDHSARTDRSFDPTRYINEKLKNRSR